MSSQCALYLAANAGMLFSMAAGFVYFVARECLADQRLRSHRLLPLRLQHV